MKASRFSTKDKLVTVLSVLCAALIILTAITGIRLNRYKRECENDSLKVLGELCESLDGITTTLHKSLYSNTRQMINESGNELYRLASVAKVSLGALTENGEQTDEIYKFLSQVGDYTVYLAQGESENFSLGSQERETLRQLYEYSQKLSEAFEQINIDYYNGSVSFSQEISNIAKESDYEKISFEESFYDFGQTFSDYPTLLYDGPFADTVINKEAKGVYGGEITAEEARAKAGEILGETGAGLKQEKDIESQIPLYCFSKGDTNISITKKGGYLCSLVKVEYAGESTISADEAVKRGLNYLKDYGYREEMQESYYSIYDGICTVNYAYKKDGVICYADLIKMSISLETGKVVSFDASGYLMNHTQRELPETVMSEDECRGLISEELQILKVQQAVIPLDTGKEELCYEFHCKDTEGQEVLIYINAVTGQEEEILLLLYGDNGVLTK